MLLKYSNCVWCVYLCISLRFANVQKFLNFPTPSYVYSIRYKARLVVKGFSRKKEVDFDEISSPVVKMSSICVVLGLAASLDLKVDQMDIKRTFLHGDLEEGIYIVKPKGIE